ncbi:MAG: porin family protein [Gemmatimonadota bacterium]|jgi:hypothetical protein
MQRSILLALTLSFVFVGSSQAQTIFDRAWGVKAGVSVAKADIGDISETFDRSNRTGFAGGLFLHQYWGLVGAQAEVNYIQKGSKLSFPTAGEEETKLDYLELAGLLKVGIPLGIVRPSVFGGLGFDIKLSCNSPEEPCDDIKSTDWIGIFGGDFAVYLGSFSIFGDARYNLGLSNIFDDPSGILDVKNQGWTFQAGVGFPIG